MNVPSPNSSGGRYLNPPIAEASIGVSFEQLPLTDLDELRTFAADLKEQYPEQGPRVQHQAQVQFGSSVGAVSSQYEDGVVCISADRKDIAQFALSAVIFSRLAPYHSWDDFEGKARPIWSRFLDRFSVKTLTLSVRYINRIEIPHDQPMEIYLKTYPEISHDLPQIMSKYFMRVDVPLGDAELVMQQGFLPSSSPELYAILLDNELRYEVQNGATAWDVAARARLEKNRIFEACITDELRERLNNA